MGAVGRRVAVVAAIGRAPSGAAAPVGDATVTFGPRDCTRDARRASVAGRCRARRRSRAPRRTTARRRGRGRVPSRTFRRPIHRRESATDDDPPPRGHARHRSRRASPTTRRLVRRVDQTDDLAYFWVQFDGEPTPFDARPVHDDRASWSTASIVQRPYSVASAPVESPATRATSSTSGSSRSIRFTTLAVAPADRPPDADDRPEGQVHARARRRRGRTSSSRPGPGIAPFISMMRQTLARRRRRAGRSSSTAARTPRSSATATCSRAGSGTATYPVTYVPTVSRPNDPAQRRLDRADGPRRGGPRVGLQGPRPAAGRRRSSTSAATRT